MFVSSPTVREGALDAHVALLHSRATDTRATDTVRGRWLGTLAVLTFELICVQIE